MRDSPRAFFSLGTYFVALALSASISLSSSSARVVTASPSDFYCESVMARTEARARSTNWRSLVSVCTISVQRWCDDAHNTGCNTEWIYSEEFVEGCDDLYSKENRPSKTTRSRYNPRLSDPETGDSRWGRTTGRSMRSSTSRRVTLAAVRARPADADASAERAETPPAPFATIPFSRHPDFVDGRNLLDQIDKRCSEPAARMALVGLGGVGKSQLAIEFTHRIAEAQHDRWVFWVHAGTQTRVEEGFRAIADALVYGWLSNERHGRWIMIFDSADDRDVFYNQASGDDPKNGGAGNKRPFATYLPQSRNGSIIVTTRNKDLTFRLTGRRQTMIEVGPMTQTDALILLKKKLCSLLDIDTATDLARGLDLVPLAISQAAAYIQARAPRSSLEKYLAEFRESKHKRSNLLQYDTGDLRRDGGASNAILMTWQISFEHIRAKRPSAVDLLSLMSFFHRQGIPECVLKPSRTTNLARERGLNEAVDEESNDGNATADREDDNTGSDDNSDGEIDGRFEDDVAMLRDYCLITTTETEDEFKMFGLMQLSTRKWLDVFKQQEIFKERVLKLGDVSNFFAHVQVALGYQPNADTAQTLAALLHNGGWYAWSQGRYDIAQQMLGKARRVREKKVGKENVVTLASTSFYALVIQGQGRLEEAKKLQVQVMETRKTKLGADHPDTLTTMGNLASTYENQGRWEEAEKLQVQRVVR
ncbi:P-loop containing nucleoside triphosphate hydrolase protein [Rhypophila sp. PSN 637]